MDILMGIKVLGNSTLILWLGELQKLIYTHYKNFNLLSRILQNLLLSSSLIFNSAVINT